MYLRPYEDDSGEWELFGRTPIEGLRVPRAVFRTRLSKAGLNDVEGAFDALRSVPLGFGNRFEYVLDESDSIPADMVRVPKGGVVVPLTGIRNWSSAPLEDYLIDRYEVTNKRFKAFVDAGGYENREYWTLPFMKDGREISWDEAIAQFHDRTGRPGPAGWELGDHPKGTEDFPVGGVSWYEAAAYAAFVGKTLPTIYHWTKATSWIVADAYTVPKSNIGEDGPSPVGSHQQLWRP